MAQVINITEEISKRRLKKVKAELEIELERLNYDMEKELNRYVIFDTSGYYELAQEEKEVVSHDSVMKLLLTARDMLVELNEADAAIEVENTITRLENNKNLLGEPDFYIQVKLHHIFVAIPYTLITIYSNTLAWMKNNH